MSTLPNLPLAWLDKLLGAGYSQITASSTTASSASSKPAQETILNFVGAVVQDNPIFGRTDVLPLAGNEGSAGLSTASVTGTTALLAEVDLTPMASGCFVLHGSVNNATILGGGWTSTDIYLTYGTVNPNDVTAMHDVRSSAAGDDPAYLESSVVIFGLSIGQPYRFGFYIKSNGAATRPTAGSGGFHVRESAR